MLWEEMLWEEMLWNKCYEMIWETINKAIRLSIILEEEYVKDTTISQSVVTTCTSLTVTSIGTEWLQNSPNPKYISNSYYGLYTSE